jgi:prolyl-tRNA synthetase
MYIWNTIRNWFQAKITERGVDEASFPMFLSKTSLDKEKDHVEGFAPELAWVTKAGDKDLEVPVAVRPTSEAVMYPYFAKWIRSHRDLPLMLNQVKELTQYLLT